MFIMSGNDNKNEKSQTSHVSLTSLPIQSLISPDFNHQPSPPSPWISIHLVSSVIQPAFRVRIQISLMCIYLLPCSSLDGITNLLVFNLFQHPQLISFRWKIKILSRLSPTVDGSDYYAFLYPLSLILVDALLIQTWDQMRWEGWWNKVEKYSRKWDFFLLSFLNLFFPSSYAWKLFEKSRNFLLYRLFPKGNFKHFLRSKPPKTRNNPRNLLLHVTVPCTFFGMLCHPIIY
jgi:hypothetical protein